MKKAANLTLTEVLNDIRREGIETREDLMANEKLCAGFWLAAQDFVNACLFSKTRETSMSGNRARVEILEAQGLTTRADLASDCLIRIVEYTDRILKKQDIAHMKHYSASVVNSVTDSALRQANRSPKIMPLDGPVNGPDSCTLEECIPDLRYEPETILAQRETIHELKQELRTKREQERRVKKEEMERERRQLPQEISKLASRPAEVFAWLGLHYLGLKPQKLAARVIDNGYEESFNQVLVEVSHKYDLDLSDIQAQIVRPVDEDAMRKDKGLRPLLSQERQAVARQLSRYADRASARLKQSQSE